jgi:hypothetical protein
MNNIMTARHRLEEFPRRRLKAELFFRIQAANQATEGEEGQDTHGILKTVSFERVRSG